MANILDGLTKYLDSLFDIGEWVYENKWICIIGVILILLLIFLFGKADPTRL